MLLSTEKDIQIIKKLVGYYFVKGHFTKTKGGSLREAEKEVT